MGKYTIEPVRNGYVVTLSYEGEDNKIEQESYVCRTLKDVLHLLVEDLEPGSRYDEKRLYILELPGDKNEKFTEEMANVIWGSYE